MKERAWAMSGERVSVVIATRNRREEVLRAVTSCLAQAEPPLEILVFDDASEDGTGEAIEAIGEPVRVVRQSVREGYIALRNRGFQEARGGIVVSLDDDAYFTSHGTLGAVVRAMAADASIAVLALPFLEPRLGRRAERTARPAPAGAELRSFTGCAHAIRRSAALEAGGYRAFFVHQGEERDLAIRLRERGGRIVQGGGPPVVHLPSPARRPERAARFGIRNALLFDVLNLPWWMVPPRLAWDAVRLAAYGGFAGLPSRGGAVVSGLAACARHAGARRPVRAATYRAFLRCPGHAPSLFRGDPPPPAVRGGGGAT